VASFILCTFINIGLEANMEFEVQDMTCGGCANAITRAVTAADPAAKLDIDVAAKIVKVESAQPAASVQAVIEAAGFHPALRAA
jgi:copper chaperone